MINRITGNIPSNTIDQGTGNVPSSTCNYRCNVENKNKNNSDKGCKRGDNRPIPPPSANHFANYNMPYHHQEFQSSHQIYINCTANNYNYFNPTLNDQSYQENIFHQNGMMKGEMMRLVEANFTG